MYYVTYKEEYPIGPTLNERIGPFVTLEEAEREAAELKTFDFVRGIEIRENC